MSAPLVSVVLPTLNRAERLRRSAGSVLAQTERDLELLVVDDGSDEDIAAAVAALNDPRARCIRREQRGGPAAARNTGIRAARGQYLAFQDSDDEWLLDKLERMLAVMREHPDTDLLICNILRIGSNGLRRVPAATKIREISHQEVLSRPADVYMQCWLAKRIVVTQAGGLDESLFLWDDWEILLRISRHHKLRRLPEPLVVAEFSEDSITGQSEKWPENLERVLSKHGEYLSGFPKQFSFHLCVLGRQWGRVGERRKAISAARRAIQVRPTYGRGWLWLLAIIAGPTALKWLFRVQRRLGQ